MISNSRLVVFASYIFDTILSHGSSFVHLILKHAADIPKATAGFLLGSAIFTQGIAHFDD